MPPEMSDYEAIRQLIARVAITFDERDVDGWVACWSTDGALTRMNGEQVRGHEALAAFVQEFPGEGRHIVSNAVIAIEGDHATHQAYVQYYDHGQGDKLIILGRYEDELVRERGAWRMLSRRTITGPPAKAG